MTQPDKFNDPLQSAPESIRIFELAENGREILEDEQQRRIDRIAMHAGRYPVELEIHYHEKFRPDNTIVVTDTEYRMMLAPYEHPDMPTVVTREIIPEPPLEPPTA
jgi:hypothetical protein